MSKSNSTVPYGYCHCGCGQRTKIARRTDNRAGHRKGESFRFILGHQNRSSGTDYVEEDRGYKTPCWIWQRCKGLRGYGVFRRDKRQVFAHRWYYEQYKGAIPGGLDLDHLCRQHDCVNPDHLEPVTSGENQRRGINTILTWPEVREIRRRYAEGGITQSELGREHGVTKYAIWRVVHRVGWRTP